jgi:glycosyltransferase involved in cell wall biosynthesis
MGFLSESQIADVMGATDIILAPFHDMPGSASLSLGIAYGKAIIGSDIEQMKELQSRGIGAELFRIDKKGDLREKIVALTRDARRRAELEQFSKAYADRYSYSNTAVQLEKLYAALLKSRSNRII